MAPFFAEQARTKAYGKRFHADFKEFGDDEVTKFVKDNC
jgi:hypothetical protein